MVDSCSMKFDLANVIYLQCSLSLSIVKGSGKVVLLR